MNRGIAVQARDYYIWETALANVVLQRVDRVVNRLARFPEDVLQDRYSSYSFATYDWLMSADFWDWAQCAMEGACGNVMFYVIEPDPFADFFSKHGYFDIATIDSAVTKEKFLGIIRDFPSEWSPDSIALNSSIVTVMPDSGKWVVWGERKHNLSMLALKSNKQIGLAQTHWTRLRDAVDRWLPPEFENKSALEAFERHMRRSYENCDFAS